jgi:hypothetical protein
MLLFSRTERETNIDGPEETGYEMGNGYSQISRAGTIKRMEP